MGHTRVTTVRVKISGKWFFPGQGEPGSFVIGRENLENTWKVGEKSGKSQWYLKINGYGSL